MRDLQRDALVREWGGSEEWLGDHRQNRSLRPLVERTKVMNLVPCWAVRLSALLGPMTTPRQEMLVLLWCAAPGRARSAPAEGSATKETPMKDSALVLKSNIGPGMNEAGREALRQVVEKAKAAEQTVPTPQAAEEPSDEELARVARGAWCMAVGNNDWLDVARALRARLARPVVVTDEMVRRAFDAFDRRPGDMLESMRAAVEAALGAPKTRAEDATPGLGQH